VSSQSNPAAPEPTEIAGRYQVVQKLGAGAMGTVYKARDRTLGRDVAIKTIRFESVAASQTGFDELLERFKREARVAAQLKHPNIVTIYDIGESAGLSYLAMEFIDGEGLDRILAKSRKLLLARAAGLTAQVADALGFAYQNGVIHRDIKPANIMVEAGDRVKVTDFGIAKPLDSAEHLTQTGGLLGTPSYMSPEQARGRKVDGRSDLFSVGCVLYELLAGRKAFTGDNITGIIFKIITEPPEPLQKIDPRIPDEAIRIVQKALSKDPETRYQSGRELADDLLALAQPGHVPTLRQADSPTAPVAPPDAPTLASPPTAQGTISSSPTVPRTAPPTAGATTPVPPTQITPDTAAPPPPPPTPAPPTPAARPRRPSAAPGRRPQARGGGRRALGIVAGVAVLALIAAGTWVVLGRGGPSPDAPAEPSPAAELVSPPPDPAPPGASGAAADAGAGTVATPAESTPTPAVVARAATPRPAPAPPRRPAPGAESSQTAPASTGPSVQQAPPPQPPPPSDVFLDELPEQPPDGRAAGQALADQYRSGGSSSSSYGSGRSFRRRPRIPPHTPAEQPAVRALAWILSAQNAHHRRTGAYGTLSALVKSGDLPLDGARTQDGFVRRQYRFTITAEGDSFRAEARPLTPRGRAFYVDDAGFVLVTE
jgi:serine/threonine-protein kinase